MRYPIVTVDRAHALLEEIRTSGHCQIESSGVVATAGAGDPFDLEAIEVLASELEIVRGSFAEDRKAFDAAACERIHRALPDGECLSDDGFWRWLALGPLLGLVMWRFPLTTKDLEDGSTETLPPKPQNFGIGASARQRSECYPYKLWLRAELGRVDEGDEYRFARRGDVDFWTSHIHRQSYTTNRRLCSALVRFQYPDELDGRPYLHSGEEDRDRKRFGIRTLAKRIRRLQATYELTLMDDSGIEQMIVDLATDLTRSGSADARV
ncbi:hypothetical protein P873_01335 [Arenimonas composti TR7-09 = DSM 18010]|uniref:Uncharacterized protein n=1 Tax=Arenimonas composti TR7-09 = DSM 18010 TaxID=1121013 RepID=A0A091B9P7_9GAMM|nr:hypothetical protein P873_01335 [Arenimonas composti TR7-09 = DSM 18010]